VWLLLLLAKAVCTHIAAMLLIARDAEPLFWLTFEEVGRQEFILREINKIRQEWLIKPFIVQFEAMMVETANTSEMSVKLYQTTRRNNQEDRRHLDARRRQKL
jgi:hypothetical protein